MTAEDYIYVSHVKEKDYGPIRYNLNKTSHEMSLGTYPEVSLSEAREKLAEQPVEKFGKNIRAMMPWISKKKLVDSDKS